ncbi:hypothetical protein ACFLZM_05120 [Thermodesulfobacteriota bacterium]
MDENRSQRKTSKKSPARMLLFPASVIGIYGVLFAVMLDKALAALINSAHIFLHIIAPLVLVFIVMLLINLFLKPAHIARFLGAGAGIKGIVLSTAAGIVSVGPIYAWYPLLKEIREKGAGNLPIAIFMNARAVKPFLLPVMILYFGWVYTLILTSCTILGSLFAGFFVGILTGKKDSI